MAAEVGSVEEPILRRSANYHPSPWGDHFLVYASDLSKTRDETEQQHLQLKEGVRSRLLAMTDDEHYSEATALEFIDAIQRLGVSYHFEDQIERALQHIYCTPKGSNNGDHGFGDDLYGVALRFRLLRQQGLVVPCEVFNEFKGNKSYTKESVASDVRGMLSLYEATQLRIHGEDTLDEAHALTVSNLESVIPNLNSSVAEQVKHALKQPIHKGLQRLEARYYLSIYGEEESHDKTLLMFAKRDFNLLQKLHQIELAEITRWWKELGLFEKLPFARDRMVECYFWILGMYFEPQYCTARRILTKVIQMTSFMDDIYDVYGTVEELELLTKAIERWDMDALGQLPEYLKVFYQALLDVYIEIEEEMAMDGRSCCIFYAKEAMKNQARAYFAEAKWMHENHMPTMEEYMGVALVSSGYPLLVTTSLVTMGDIATEDTFEWIFTNPKIIQASAIIARLMDDLVSHKFEQERGHVASAVECYMNECGVSEQHAAEELRRQVTDAWKDINEECLRSTAAPKPIHVRVLNLARVMDVLYKDGDGYTHCGTALKDHVASLLIHPVPA